MRRSSVHARVARWMNQYGSIQQAGAIIGGGGILAHLITLKLEVQNLAGSVNESESWDFSKK
jgi:hypothetical protein